ncbi:MAG: Zn-dependent hydrolase [Bacteroidales bacterium]|nr:Zn-dependent hydrolase [Bacteroidales bacterium]MCF8345111.1 Zn-dependent hydrolase [Bacteroidales bacterium]MCF8351973.1 Zn-dependent hydrolase [Bacteroidales bacterium]MCF8377475.1 Zn-dependent hydrolase [Bacteroidales bacterium]MCF8401598.1 Zn-dependent hydrolase [Bacteroidales bacterium]
MIRRISFMAITAAIVFTLAACKGGKKENKETKKLSEMEQLVNKYATFELTSDLSYLSENQKQMLVHLFEASKIMNKVFWKQAYGDKEELLEKYEGEDTIKFIKINYGPWDRLNGNEPFLPGHGAKPKGANFYPADMSVEEFENWDDPDKKNLYTLIRRDENGDLQSVWYSEAYKEEFTKAAELLKTAAELAESEDFKKYLNVRAEALLSNEYQPSDFAWMDMKDNDIDLVFGPIENYEDQLFGYKAACEAFILIKDKEWSDKLAKYAKFLPQLQKELPVEPKYKKETPGSDADLNAYDAIYYAGDCNAGSKTIAINLPNDEEVQLKKGTRKLQLKNSMQAKFDKILVPISKVVIDPQQRKHVTFDAFFANTMFHEVAHGMGIKMTITGDGTVREALKESYSSIEEGKADIMGLYLVTKLFEMDEYDKGELMDNYVTFFAGIFRSSRFGAASAHGKANMMRFNYFLQQGAFLKNEDGTYSVDFEKMKEAMIALMQKILKIQGEGDYENAKQWVDAEGIVKQQFQEDLDRINSANIPVDIVFKQGPKVVGLK